MLATTDPSSRRPAGPSWPRWLGSACRRSPIASSAPTRPPRRWRSIGTRWATRGPRVAVAGRIAAWRPKGKVMFGHIEDSSGRIQVYLRKDDLGAGVGHGPAARPRRPCRHHRHAVPHPHRRGDGARARGRAPGQEPPSTASREDPADCIGRGDLRRAARSRGALPAALRRPRGASRRARGVRDPGRGDPLSPPVSRRARVSRGGDAGAAAALRRRRGPAVRHPPQRARHAALPPHRGRALPQAADRRRARAGLRDRPRLPERGDGPDPQPRVHHARVLPGLRRLRRHDGPDRGDGVRRGAARHRRARGHLHGLGDRLHASVPPARVRRGRAPAAGSTSDRHRRRAAAELASGVSREDAELLPAAG